jgi:hypothetical protein
LSVLGEENTDGSIKLNIIVRSKSDANKVGSRVMATVLESDDFAFKSSGDGVRK